MTIIVYWKSGATEEFVGVTYFNVSNGEVQITVNDDAGGVSWILNFAEILKIKKVPA